MSRFSRLFPRIAFLSVFIIVIYFIAQPVEVRAFTAIRQSVNIFNDTQNQDAGLRDVQRENFLTFTFTSTNAGTLVETDTPSIDLSPVLPLVDVVNTYSGTFVGKTLTYPSQSLAPGESRQEKLQVRVRYSLPPFRYVLSVKYGNTSSATIASLLVGGNSGKYIAPSVGASTDLAYALLFAGALLATYVGVKWKYRLFS